MSPDLTTSASTAIDIVALAGGEGGAMPALHEARRQMEICNACRYCEGFCSVFPAMTRSKAFSDADLTHLANLCHNCRGCYYACQYTAPHEFALNVPAALAHVRQESWETFAWPGAIARRFHESGVALTAVVALALAALLAATTWLRPASGAGFYAFMSHNLMVAIFAPAFVLPVLALGVAVGRYWRAVGAGPVALSHLAGALRHAASLRNLGGGQGQGCNFEGEDRFSNVRRWYHQAVMYGFALCFAATSSATVMHYALGWPAPYGLLSLPKLLGIPGGIAMVVGAAGLAGLKLRADPALGAARVWGAEMAFVLLLGAVALTGLVLYGATGTMLVAPLLALHLATVLTLFLLIPYSKMAHGAFRFAALLVEEQRQR